METILFLLGIVIPFAAYGFIGYFIGALPRILTGKPLSQIDGILSSSAKSILSWVLGLEIHLISSFAFYIYFEQPVFKSYWYTLILILSTATFVLSRKNHLIQSLRNYFSLKDFPKLSLNGILFFTVTFWIGITIFSIGDGVKTFWANNYGDIAIHFGLIMNYIHGAIPLREYHIFPGEYLSYSVLVDFWSALLISASPSLLNLHAVFVLQWTLIWLITFCSLSRYGHKVFPWIVLLGGGTWIQFLSNVDLYSYQEGLKGYSHILIDKGFSVTNLLACIWIPQRTSLYGLLTLVVGLAAFGELFLKRNRIDSNYDDKNSVLFQIGALYGISLLANFHMALVGGFIVGTYVTVEAIYDILERKRFKVYPVMFALSIFFFTYFAYRHYSGKESMISFADGWMNSTEEEVLSYTLNFWLLNLTILILPILYFLFNLQRTLLVCITALFLFGNFVSLSSWEWDNYKLFIGIFVSLLMLSTYRTRPSEMIEILLVLSIFPGIFETGKSISHDSESVIYSKDDISNAEKIRSNTPKNSIIAGAPNHNTSISLAGRKIYYGYAGWLDSHNINSGDRDSINSSINEIKNCKVSENGNCPDYVTSELFSKKELISAGFIEVIPSFLYSVPK